MATTTSIFSDEILAKADSAREADAAYERAFVVWRMGLPTLQPDHFWPFVEKFVNCLGVPCGDRDWVQHGAEELMRVHICEDEDALAAAVHFAASYGAYTDMACKRVRKLNGWGHADWSDDGLSDLCDALPMMGRDLFTRLIEGKEFFDHTTVRLADLKEAIRQTRGDKWVPVILDGENYFGMMLTDAAQEKMRYVLNYRQRSHDKNW